MLTRDQFIEQLSTLISFRTVAGSPEAISALFGFLKSVVDPRLIVSEISESGRPIMKIATHATTTPHLGILVHADVVPGEQHQFTAQVREDRIYGRGALDMKFAIPISLALLHWMLDEQLSNFSAELVITSDEEGGGYAGAGYLVDRQVFQPEVLLVPDGGTDFVVIHKSKGVLQLAITFVGKSTHASCPWSGTNALVAAAQCIVALENAFENANRTEGWNSTANIARCSTDNAVNQVPAEATITVDIRYVPEADTPEQLVERVRTIADSIGLQYQIKVLEKEPAMFVDPAEAALLEFTQALEKTTGRAIAVRGSHGASDARFFSTQGVPILMSQPLGGDIHGPAEWIDVSSALRFYEALQTWVRTYTARCT